MKKEFKSKNGKGSERRPENFRAVQRNWDKIKWGHTWCAWCGKWGNHSSGGCKDLKKCLGETK